MYISSSARAAQLHCLASWMMPTTVIQGLALLLESRRKRLPRASSPGQKRCAMVWLITATGGADSLSRSSKSRPRTSRIPMVWK